MAEKVRPLDADTHPDQSEDSGISFEAQVNATTLGGMLRLRKTYGSDEIGRKPTPQPYPDIEGRKAKGTTGLLD